MAKDDRNILRIAPGEVQLATGGLGKEIVGLFSKVGLKFDILELHGQKITPLDFEP